MLVSERRKIMPRPKKTTKKPAKKSRKTRHTILNRKKTWTLQEFVEYCRLHGSYRTNGVATFFMLDYDYDEYHPCRHGSDCCDNDYCTCGQITNTRVKDSITFSLPLKLKTIDQYYFDRVIRLSAALDPESWDVGVVSGYYGQEIGKITLDSSVEAEILQRLNVPDKTSDVDKIKKLLEFEYGYVLPVLEPMNKVKIVDVNPKNLLLFNDRYYGKAKNNLYDDYDLPVCVVRKDPAKRGKYIVIDGYHRLSSNMNKQKVQVFELYEKE